MRKVHSRPTEESALDDVERSIEPNADLLATALVCLKECYPSLCRIEDAINDNVSICPCDFLKAFWITERMPAVIVEMYDILELFAVCGFSSPTPSTDEFNHCNKTQLRSMSI